ERGPNLALGLGGDEDADLVEEGEVLRPVHAADVPGGHRRRVLGVAPPPAPRPHLRRVPAVRVVRHHLFRCAFPPIDNDGDGEALVVGPRDALQLVQPGEAVRRDGVELPADALAAVLAGQVEEEGDAVGPADEREGFGRRGGGHEGRVPRARQVLQQAVVGEAPLQRAVREHQRPLRLPLRRRRRLMLRVLVGGAHGDGWVGAMYGRAELIGRGGWDLVL
uniref:Uncharacterized protein n=1 Tax=Triticum urartu TaxID=4572 RepID=A0A8R7Q959_TRIUA